jgi:hypothetical protein
MTNEIDLNDCHIEMRMGRSGSGWYLYLYLPWELQAININPGRGGSDAIFFSHV